MSRPLGIGAEQVSKEATNRSFDDLAHAVAEGSLSRLRVHLEKHPCDSWKNRSSQKFALSLGFVAS